MPHAIRCALVALVALCWGCTVGDPDPIPLDSKVPDLPGPDLPTGCPAVPTLPAPKLAKVVAPTCSLKPPFRGTAVGAERVTAVGNAGNAKPANVGPSGVWIIPGASSSDLRG